MKIAVRHQRPELELQRARTSDDRETNVRRVRSVRHPDAAFDQRVGQRECPDRQRTLEPKADQIAVSVWINGAVGVLVCGQCIALTGVGRPIHRAGHEHRALDRRRQRRDQQPVVPPGVDAGYRSRCVSTQTVGDQPLTAQCIRQIGGDLWPKVDQRVVQDGNGEIARSSRRNKTLWHLDSPWRKLRCLGLSRG